MLKKFAIMCGVCMLLSSPMTAVLSPAGYEIVPSAHAAGNPFETVQPKDWDYKALQTLVSHGVITDMHGVSLGTRSYMRYELTPLISDAHDKSPTLNESDRMLAERLYNAYADAVSNYRREKRRNAEAVSGANPSVVPSITNESKSSGAAMTQEDIARKMENFTIDDSALKKR